MRAAPPIPMRPCFRCDKETNETQSVYGVGCLECFLLGPKKVDVDLTGDIAKELEP